MKPEQVMQVQEWINQGYGNNRRAKWKLLYCASQDGYGAKDFHRCCDNQGPTVTIVKPQGGIDILGGYTPLNWTSKDVKVQDKSHQSFVFSLGNKNVFSKLKATANIAISNYSSWGPIFRGNTGNNRDLCIANNLNGDYKSFCSQNGYEFPLSHQGLFSVNDYEVFQVQIDYVNFCQGIETEFSHF